MEFDCSESRVLIRVWRHFLLPELQRIILNLQVVGKRSAGFIVYIGYWTLALNTQLAFIILDKLSIVIRTIEANDAGSADI